MKWWTELVTENPMRIETVLFFRKFLAGNAIGNTVAIGVIGALLCFLGAMMFVYEQEYYVPVVGALLVFTFGIPVILHGAIAGERERRSWEMLMVAPITKTQIVIGKFTSILFVIGIVTAILAAMMCLTTFPSGRPVSTIIVVTTMVAAYGLSLSAYTILVSSFCKRSISALSIVYGSLFAGFLVFPMFFIGPNAQMDAAFYLNPFFAMVKVNEVSIIGNVETNAGFFTYGIVHIFVYSAMAALFLYIAANHLNTSGIEDPINTRSR